MTAGAIGGDPENGRGNPVQVWRPQRRSRLRPRVARNRPTPACPILAGGFEEAAICQRSSAPRDRVDTGEATPLNGPCTGGRMRSDEGGRDELGKGALPAVCLLPVARVPPAGPLNRRE